MIYFSFTLKNPFSQRWDIASSKSGLLGKHKAWEFNTYKTAHIISVDFRWDFKTDHAGIQLSLGALGRDVEFTFYDRRHWDSGIDGWADSSR
jgi:hypothetical protein